MMSFVFQCGLAFLITDVQRLCLTSSVTSRKEIIRRRTVWRHVYLSHCWLLILLWSPGLKWRNSDLCEEKDGRKRGGRSRKCLHASQWFTELLLCTFADGLSLLFAKRKCSPNKKHIYFASSASSTSLWNTSAHIT